jgi:hypothetical protein
MDALEKARFQDTATGYPGRGKEKRPCKPVFSVA